MKAIIALCSMILLFSFTGIQAQTESVPVAGDSLQNPAPTASSVPETTAPITKAVTPIPNVKVDNSLTGVKLFSCSGLYFYNKSVYQRVWYDGTGYETTYKTTVSAMLVNVNYIVDMGFSLGATIGVLLLSQKEESDFQSAVFNGDDYNSTFLNLIGPRLAYYYGKKDSKVIPFAAFEFDILSSDYYSDNAMRIGAGILLQPKPHFGISFGLDYLKFGEEEKSTNIIGVLGLTGIIY